MRSTRTGHRWAAMMVAAMLTTLAAAIAAPAQTFKTLVNFNGSNGVSPQYMNLVQGTDGDLYGTATSGGAYGYGTIFKLSPTGAMTIVYSFCAQANCTDGALPNAGLVLGTDANFYGTTEIGGANGAGTVFKITLGGVLTSLYSFDWTYGAYPEAGLIQAMDGDFYGTSYDGGPGGYGTIFKITPVGKLVTLYDFCSQDLCRDGYSPLAPLVQAADGNFYGTTLYGGSGIFGTIFKITPGGALTTLFSFDWTHGANPYGALVQATDGSFYGTTQVGGTSGYGTVVRIAPTGRPIALYSFCSQTACNDGEYPLAGLVEATDGSFYGTTYTGGANGSGEVFKITPGGTLNILHNFDGTDGANPEAALVQATNGSLYGTTYREGADGYGTVFGVSLGLGPFVKTVPSIGKVGRSVIILGTNLRAATSVSFNGTPASFTVQSATAVKTTVPGGATTGPVQVVTPSGTLTSNVNFRVE